MPKQGKFSVVTYVSYYRFLNTDPEMPRCHLIPGYRYVQIGVVHGSVGACGSSDFPGIFVRLDHPLVVDFIASTFEPSLEGNLLFALMAPEARFCNVSSEQLAQSVISRSVEVRLP
jgi:hypothetical protein